MLRMRQDLVDRIYESAFQPALWPRVLDELADIAQARGGVLFTARERVMNWTGSANLKDIFQIYLTDGWLSRCNRKTCWLTSKTPGFLVEHDVWTDEELDKIPIYREFLRPRGLGWSAGTAMRMPTGDNLVVSFERDFCLGPIEPDSIHQLNELLPHIGRSAFVAARLKIERAQSAGDAMVTLGLPVIVIDRCGVIQSTNALCDALGDFVRWQAGAPVSFKDIAAQALLDKGISALNIGSMTPPLSFPIRDANGEAQKIAHLVPIRRSAGDIFSNAFAMLLFTPLTPPGVPTIELLRSLFDLTPAEARLARAIACGANLQEAAAAIGVTHNTVRTQLRSVLGKIGCHRQSDLVALIGNLSLDRAAGSRLS